jgi:N-acetylmuramoyl-L-alanine amidase
MGARLAEALRSTLAVAGSEASARPLTIAILRETRMPAVQCELAVIENPDEAARVAADGFATAAASALADGLEAFLGAVPAVDRVVRVTS